MKNERETYLKEMHMYRRKVTDSQTLADYLAIALLAGVFVIWLIHVFVPNFLPTDEFKGFEMGYSFILFLFLFCGWLKRRRLQSEYADVYKKFIASK